MREVKVNRFLTLKIEDQPTAKKASGKATKHSTEFVPCDKPCSEMTEAEVAAEIKFYLVKSGVIPRQQQPKAPQFAANRHFRRVKKAAAA